MLREATTADLEKLLDLHQKVAAIPGGVIRSLEEITLEYVQDTLQSSLQYGLMLVLEQNDQLVGSIHAYTPGLQAFRHLLTELTIIVHPDHQRKGIGRELFTVFLEEVQRAYTHILRVELFVRITNTAAIRFYESLGFQQEGIQQDKIFNAQDMLETPVAMAWRNPAFKAHSI